MEKGSDNIKTTVTFENVSQALNTSLMDVMRELYRAKRKHPHWPDNLAECNNFITEEVGELAQAINDYNAYINTEDVHEARQKLMLGEIKTECMQVASTALRFMERLEEEYGND